VALLSRNDRHHDWVAAQADTLPWPWFTCHAALTEAFFLLGKMGAPRLKDLLRHGAVVLSYDLGDQLAPVLDLMDKYADVPMSLADSCLVRMSETLPDPVVRRAPEHHDGRPSRKIAGRIARAQGAMNLVTAVMRRAFIPLACLNRFYVAYLR